MDLILYPNTVGDAPRILLHAVISRDFVSTQVVRAYYHLLGYGLQQLYPDLTATAALEQIREENGKAVEPMTEDQFKEHLEMLCGTRTMAMPAGAFPWASLIITLLPIIQEWLRNR